MKKKISLFLILALSILALSACGGEGGGSSSQVEIPDDGFSFTYEGTTIKIHDPAADVLSALGEELSYTETASCAFEGVDKTYEYEHFYLMTYPNGDTDYVQSFWFKDSEVSTQEGIALGSSYDDVAAAYGEDYYNGSNAFVIASGEMTLTIMLSNDAVTSIQYIAVFE